MSGLNDIKTCLLELHSFDDTETFSKLQEEVRKFIGQPGVTIGISPLFMVNDHFVFSAIHNVNSIVFKDLETDEEKEKVSEALQKYFKGKAEPLVVNNFDGDALKSFPFLKHMDRLKAVIICPLKNFNRLIGILEIAAGSDELPVDEIITTIEPALPLFELAMNRSCATLDARLDKIIREHFTAIQPSVEWRFSEAALSYLQRSEKDEDTKMENIVFENVFPLYGAIDVRNSSIERNKAIRQDILEQIDMAGNIITKAYSRTQLPLLDEVGYKLKKFRDAALESEVEPGIAQFFNNEVKNLFSHLLGSDESLHKEINEYLKAADTVNGMIYHHHKEFDESLTHVNKVIAKFIDKEQEAVQEMYPHYFERFVTDGIDFNIYIGQSISPQTDFNEIYLRNLKIWQVTVLAKAAQLSAALAGDLAIPLHTTQLILAHSQPISISFRPAERKFDVDGAYNIRYEIIKKRIDKVHIKDKDERLTQPGCIGIVYSQPKEAEEYEEYIEYLADKGLFTRETEYFDLEDLQGVSGLKAMRVKINIGGNIKNEELRLQKEDLEVE